MNKASSPSRRYVAMCSGVNFDGYHFRTFTLPAKDDFGGDVRNDTAMAAWYFLNRLDFGACIEGCVTEENFRNVSEVKPMFSKKEDER